MNVLDLATRKVNLRKVSGTNGGEWQGPCPGCGGTDRFHVWPNQNEGKGAYWCRGCEKSGDNIQFLRDFDGMGYRQACEYLGEKIHEAEDPHGTPTQKKDDKPAFQPQSHGSPAEIWQERAERFVTWSQEHLQKNTDVMAWLEDRGIGSEAAVNYRLGWNPGDKGNDIYRSRKSWGLPEEFRNDGRPKMLWIPIGLVIPYIVDGIVHRIRIRRPEGDPRYYVIPGSSMSTMILGRDRRAFVVVEAELDAIAVASGNDLAGSVGLGSASTKPDAGAFDVLHGSLQILNALDYDAAGAKAMAWWTEQFPQCDRWPVPQGKDPGEAIKMGTDLKSWIKAGLPPAMTIEDGAALKTATLSQDRPALPAAGTVVNPELPVAVRELYQLLRNNPSVQIINDAQRYTVLRQGKHVGGRINELVFRVQESRDYLLNHPAEIIDGKNLIYQQTRRKEDDQI
jgi:hypothetical protein